MAMSEGHVYYLRNGDLIKIGYAKHVYARMAHYPPNAELLAVEPGDKKLEQARHWQFAHYLRYGREWFREGPELMEWIDEIHDPESLWVHTYEYTQPKRGTAMTGKHWTGHK